MKILLIFAFAVLCVFMTPLLMMGVWRVMTYRAIRKWMKDPQPKNH